MATPASKVAAEAKEQVTDNMTKQLDGPLKTMRDLEDKFSIVKDLHLATYPPINAAKSGLDSMAMSDTTSGNPAGGAAALATIAVNEGLVATMKRMSDEYAKVKMKMLRPVEFARTKVNGDLGYQQSQFAQGVFFNGVTDGVYELEPDQTIIDEVDSNLREVGGRFDYTRDLR